MSKIINHIIFTFQSVTILFSFLISLLLIGNKKIPKYMKGFYWYPLVAIIILIPRIISEFYGKYLVELSIITNNISLLFHFSFLSFFIYRVTSGFSVRLFYFLFYFFLFLVLFFLSVNNISKHNSIAFATTNLGLIVFCIIYFYKLFNNNPILNLRRESAFWIITGILFCMSVHIPIYAALDYLRLKVSYDELKLIASGTSFSYAVMHIFFIKGILCSLHQQRH